MARRRKIDPVAIETAMLALEAQQVIALRLMKLAVGGPAAKKEANRMVAEKIAAGTKAAGMIAASPKTGPGRAVRMLRKRVRANRKRLLGFT